MCRTLEQQNGPVRADRAIRAAQVVTGRGIQCVAVLAAVRRRIAAKLCRAGLNNALNQ